MSGGPQWKPQKSKKSKELLRKLHLERADCALAGDDCSGRIELHHLLGGAYGREDHISNIIKLCQIHHLAITANDIESRMELGLHLLHHRQDMIAYVRLRLGRDAGDDWLRRRLFIDY